MFGNKRNKIEEQINEIFSGIKEQRAGFETRVSQIESSEKSLHNDVYQIMGNANELVTHAMLNVDEEAALIHTIDDFSRELSTAVAEYSALTEMVSKQLQSVMDLVEENKHYTSPAKYLTEAPASLKQSCESYEEQLDEMAENGRKMGVMALNAAIEAGRMGDSAKQFVAASEEIRQTALGYEKAALSMKEEIISQKARINELEEMIHHMVALTKESNMGAARLLKKSQETQNFVNQSKMRDFSEDMIIIRDKVVGMRNLDEEIAKCGERNKLALSDVSEELLNQKNRVVELESDLSYLFDAAEEQLR